MQLGLQIWPATVAHFRRCGADRRECVVFWVGPASDAEVIDEVVHPRHTASLGHYEVDPGWMNAFWVSLAEEQRSIRAQVHTHAGTAFHSPTDDAWPVIRQTGFLSLVVPDFARGAERSPKGLYLARLSSELEWKQVMPADFLGGLR